MSDAVDERPCPACGTPVATSSEHVEGDDQLALGRVRCASCGALLERAVDGPADHGWRRAEGGAPITEA